MNKIALYIPNYNGADYLRNVYIPKECDCVVLDNASTDESAAVCRQRGFICVENDVHVSRTQNWLRCIEHFRKQDYEWMKWLFTGDELSEDAYNIMSDAADRAQQTAVILFDYYIDTGKKIGLKTWSNHFNAGMVSAKDAVLSSIEIGTFSSPIGLMLSKRCAFDDIDIEGYSWAADVQLLYQLIGENDIYYCNKPIGVFNSRLRKTYSANKRKLSSYLESESVVYDMYRKYRSQYPDEAVDGTWFQRDMAACISDNLNSMGDIFNMCKLLIKGVGKFLLKKNGGDVKL